MYVAQNICAGVCGCWGSQGVRGQGVWKTKLAIKKSKLFYMYAALFFVGGRDPQKLILNWYPRICNPYGWDIQIWRCEWTQGKKWPKVNLGLKIVNYFTCMRHFSCRWYGPSEVDLNGYPRISNPYCRDIQIRRCEWTQGKKWPKVNLGLKIVNYFTCMRYFSCRWYRPPEVDLNWYPSVSNPYCRDIQIWRCEWTQGKKMTQSKSPIKNSKLFYMNAALLL